MSSPSSSSCPLSSLRGLLDALASSADASARREALLALVTAAASLTRVGGDGGGADGQQDVDIDEDKVAVLFRLCASEDEEESAAASKVLLALTALLESGRAVRLCRLELAKALTGPREAPRAAAARILLRASEAEEAARVLMADKDSAAAVLPLVDTLKDDSLSAAKMAMRFLVNLSRFPPDTRAQYFDNEIRSRLEALASGGRAQNRLRVYEVAVDIAKRSREHLIWIGDFDILPRLVEEIRSVDDPLSAAGALEVATGLTETQWGLQWLEQKAVLREIDGQLANIAASDFASLLLPRFVEFMGVAGKNYHSPSFFDSYPGFKRQLAAQISDASSSDNGDALLALQTVAHLCRNPARKLALLRDNNPEFLHLFFDRLGDFVLRNRGDLRAEGLAVLADVVGTNSSSSSGGGEETEERANDQLFAKFSSSGTESGASLLMKFAQMPFEAVSVMSYEVLLRMASQRWGLEAMDRQPGMMEFLMNRSAPGGQRKRVMELKHSILEAASVHPAAADVFQPSVLAKITEYVGRGVYFSQSMEMEVSVDV